jgi:tetratricopeptide (TPR) repeat protein
MLGDLYLEMDNLTQAKAFFEQAIAISQSIAARPELANSYYDLAQLYKRLNQKNKVREYLRLAQEIYRDIDMEFYQEIKKELLALEGE